MELKLISYTQIAEATSTALSCLLLFVLLSHKIPSTRSPMLLPCEPWLVIAEAKVDDGKLSIIVHPVMTRYDAWHLASEMKKVILDTADA